MSVSPTMMSDTPTPSLGAGSGKSPTSPAPETVFPTPKELLKLVSLNEVSTLWDATWGPEYWLIPAITRYLKPATILELGTEYAYSTRLFRATAPSAKITSIDINDCTEFINAPDINFICTSSQDLAKTWSEPIDLLFIDTDHTFAQVTLELNAFAPFVRQAILLHDTVSFKSEVEHAVMAWLIDHSEWTYSNYPVHYGMGILWRNS